jgi:hypothetical protein
LKNNKRHKSKREKTTTPTSNTKNVINNISPKKQPLYNLTPQANKSKHEMTSLKKTIIAIAIIGATLLIIGITLWLYTNNVIQGHQQLLNNPNISQDERWAYEGSLQWWQTAKKTTYDPTTIILITTGACTLELAIIYTITQQ